MSNIAFRLRLTYKNVDEEIPNLDYKVTFQSLVFPTTTRIEPYRVCRRLFYLS